MSKMKVGKQRITKRTAVVIHRIRNRSCTLKDLSSRETLLVETLVVTAACGCESDTKLRSVDGGDVGDELGYFWGSDAMKKEDQEGE